MHVFVVYFISFLLLFYFLFLFFSCFLFFCFFHGYLCIGYTIFSLASISRVGLLSKVVCRNDVICIWSNTNVTFFLLSIFLYLSHSHGCLDPILSYRSFAMLNVCCRCKMYNISRMCGNSNRQSFVQLSYAPYSHIYIYFYLTIVCIFESIAKYKFKNNILHNIHILDRFIFIYLWKYVRMCRSCDISYNSLNEIVNIIE